MMQGSGIGFESNTIKNLGGGGGGKGAATGLFVQAYPALPMKRSNALLLKGISQSHSMI